MSAVRAPRPTKGVRKYWQFDPKTHLAHAWAGYAGWHACQPTLCGLDLKEVCSLSDGGEAYCTTCENGRLTACSWCDHVHTGGPEHCPEEKKCTAG